MLKTNALGKQRAVRQHGGKTEMATRLGKASSLRCT